MALCAGNCKPNAPVAEQSPIDDAWFEESRAATGLDFQHVAAITRHVYFPEIMSGGVCLLDYDNDGFLDIYFVQGGALDPSEAPIPHNMMFRNRGDGTFEDVTEITNTGNTGYGMGCACDDYDGDGRIDLYVTNVGSNVLYHNNGDGTFKDVTEFAGVGDAAWGTSVAFVDVDRDDHPDLFVVNYIDWSIAREVPCLSSFDQKDYCHPNNYRAPAQDRLYRNTGDGRFEDITDSAGLTAVTGNGLGIAVGDFNADGYTDIYVANDGMPNQLWLNQKDGTFLDRALITGCALNRAGSPEAGMGASTIDINHDGLPDIFLSHLTDESNTLYRNFGAWFEDTTSAFGLADPSYSHTGFGFGFADFNHDGLLDLYIANGRVTLAQPVLDPQMPYATENLFFRGSEDGRFIQTSPMGGDTNKLLGTSRGAAFGDIDNDGDIDIIVMNNDAAPHVLRNMAGDHGNWIMFRVLNTNGNNALGASVKITANGKHQWRQVQRAYSYCSSNDPRVHFGLASSTHIENTIVRWPDGQQESFGPFNAGAIHELRHGTGQPIPNPPDGPSANDDRP